jgi:hypothetical protein
MIHSESETPYPLLIVTRLQQPAVLYCYKGYRKGCVKIAFLNH